MVIKVKYWRRIPQHIWASHFKNAIKFKEDFDKNSAESIPII